MRSADVIVEAAKGTPVDAASVPARGGVVLLGDAAARPILLATTADARAFARKRLGHGAESAADAAESATPNRSGRAGGATRGSEEGAERAQDLREAPDLGVEGRRGPRADLASIAGRVEFWACGSGLEADLAFLGVARERMPTTWEALTERWRSWFIHLNPDGAVPVWKKTNLGDLGALAGPAGVSGVDPAFLIGPIATKDGAGRFGEGVDDAFDLCRFPRELALSPRGTACAYKEMGRCPAPCDGSESMASYRGRVREAVATLRVEPGLRGGGLEAAMREASAAQDFERAAGLKSRLDRLAAMGKPALREARPLDTFRFVGVLGAGRAGWARVWRIDAWSCEAVADVDASRAKESAAEVVELAGRWEAERGAGDRRGRARLNVGGVPTRALDPVLLGIVGRHLLAPAAKRRGGFLRLGAAVAEKRGDGGPGDVVDRTAVVRLLRGAARLDAVDVDEFDRATLS